MGTCTVCQVRARWLRQFLAIPLSRWTLHIRAQTLGHLANMQTEGLNMSYQCIQVSNHGMLMKLQVKVMRSTIFNAHCLQQTYCSSHTEKSTYHQSLTMQSIPVSQGVALEPRGASLMRSRAWPCRTRTRSTRGTKGIVQNSRTGQHLGVLARDSSHRKLLRWLHMQILNYVFFWMLWCYGIPWL